MEGASERTLKIVRKGNIRKVIEEKVRDGVFTPFCFDIVSVDDRPVPEMSPTPTMDFLVGAVEEELLNALIKCGFNTSGGPPSGAFETGIPVKAIVDAWKSRVPINPSRKENRKEYDQERNRRNSAVINLMHGLNQSGDIRRISGSISKSNRTETMKAVVVQVVGDDED